MCRYRFEGGAECFRENSYYRVCVNYGRSEMHLIKPLGQQVVKLFTDAAFKGNVDAVTGLRRGTDPRSDLSWVLFGISRISLCSDLAKCITRS